MRSSPPVPSAIESPHGEVRFEAALRWLTQQERNRPLLVVAHSLDAARDLLRAATIPRRATFGWALEALTSLTMKLAALPLARRGMTPATPLALEAVCVRVVAELSARGQLGRFEHVADRPGLPRALLRTFSDLALADASLGRLHEACPELLTAYERYRQTLSELGLADRAETLRSAIAAVPDKAAAGELEAVCLYDLAPKTKLERALVDALGAAAGRSFSTWATGDGAGATSPEPHRGGTALERLQAQLFTADEAAAENDGSVSILSAPGEARECVEIARRVLAEAERGVPFDRMAILLRSPFHYRSHLLEALRRARIPAHFTRGAVRPEPGGRALLVLLRCAAEGASAVRFAEYLSLGVAPSITADTASQAGHAVPTPPLDEGMAALLRPPPDASGVTQPEEALPDSPSSQFPRRWESLLVDAAVVGGFPRWQRRLAGLEQELIRKAQAAEGRSRAQRDLEAVRALARFALPLVQLLSELPARAKWGQWLELLRELTDRAVAKPELVLGVLSELEIVREVGPVTLTEVRAVLEARLGEVQPAQAAAVGGQVLVASVEEARGRVFETVFVPGLAEKLFPQRVAEDPLLPDGLRGSIGPELETQTARVHGERQALRIAVGCARARLVLSYPRFESDKARPRVPSFYALEALRAAEGTLPGFADLARRADATSGTRMGWPAPERPEDAIDASEYDLATLRLFLTGQKQEVEGAARYLVTEHRTLGRALQARARRWRPEWRNVDGLVDPGPEARSALSARYEQLYQRGFSVTALERYAACPYRFYLSTVVGLRPRDTARQVEELDGATRGMLFHEIVQRAALKLEALGLLSPDSDPEAARQAVDREIDEVAEKWRDDIAPAIDRVWQDAVEDLRLDVRRWLEQLRESDWRPLALELPFGLGPASEGAHAPAVTLDFGLVLRGQIDAVEERQGALRATDYKTGEAPPPGPSIVAGGAQLQPALYALVLEKLFPGRQVSGGNAYYCTTRGGFARRQVELNELTREAARQAHAVIVKAFSDGFFPAAPAEGACKFCDYRAGCGPYERERVARKQKGRLELLDALRNLR